MWMDGLIHERLNLVNAKSRFEEDLLIFYIDVAKLIIYYL